MSPLEYSKARLHAALEEVRRLKESEFPYPHSKEALAIAEAALARRVALLEKVANDPEDTIRGVCAESLKDLFKYLPLLGFLLRSTNLRNAFEVYGPLLHLCRQVIGKQTRLILSSEWEDYSPFLKPFHALGDFVLIGLPAPESANPLIIPLAGHELGHTVWKKHEQKTNAIVQKITEQIFDEIEKQLPLYREIYPEHKAQKNALRENPKVNDIVHVVKQWAMSQAEEYFCDFVGLFLFDQAYLHAVAYLLSPTVAGRRSPTHPTFRNRAEKLVKASDYFRRKAPKGYTVPGGFTKLFENQSGPTERYKQFIFSLADLVAANVANDLMELTETILTDVGVPRLAAKSVNSIRKAFKHVVPAANAGSLVNILNAGWDVYHDQVFWKNMSQIKDREHILKELILKNIEVLEIEQIMEGHHDR